MWHRTNVSKLWLCVNSRYMLRLWHSTRQKAYSLRCVAVVVERAEVPPVDVEAIAGLRFHAHVGAARGGLLADCVQIVLQDRDAAVVAERAQSLRSEPALAWGSCCEQFRDGRLEGSSLLAAVAMARRRRWSVQILGHRAPADVQVARDLAQRPLLDQ